MSMHDCIFCKIIDKEIKADIVYENANILAFRDINPQAPAHVLVIPKKHISTLMDISDEDNIYLRDIYKAIQDIARDENIAEDGFRVVANCNKLAGQEVFHIHFHILGGRKLTWPPG